MFPYRRRFTKETSIEILTKISKGGDLDNHDLVSFITDEKSIFPTAIISDERTYLEGAFLTDFYNEAARIHTQVWDSSRGKYFESPYSFWQRIRNQNYFKNLSISNQREYIYSHTREATLFNIFVTVKIYNLVAKRIGTKIRIFDPFSGWGCRAIAACASSQVENYTGVDCNPYLCRGYQLLKKELDFQNRLEFIASSIEDESSIPKNGQYDLVFTSPPFFIFESYETKSGKQSTDTYSNYSDWLSFISTAFQRISRHLAPGGYIMIHLGNTGVAPNLEQDIQQAFSTFLNFVQKVNLQTKLSDGTLKRPVPIYVFQNIQLRSSEQS